MQNRAKTDVRWREREEVDIGRPCSGRLQEFMLAKKRQSGIGQAGLSCHGGAAEEALSRRARLVTSPSRPRYCDSQSRACRTAPASLYGPLPPLPCRMNPTQPSRAKAHAIDSMRSTRYHLTDAIPLSPSQSLVRWGLASNRHAESCPHVFSAHRTAGAGKHKANQSLNGPLTAQPDCGELDHDWMS